MKKRIGFLVYPLMIMGVCLLFLTGCKKEPAEVVVEDPTKFVTVQIPAGSFTMGSPASENGRLPNEIQHKVTLSAFSMSKYEITNIQYAAFLNAKLIGSNGKYSAGAYPNEPLIYASSGLYDWGLHYTGSKWEPVEGFGNNPVILVTWFGATEYATYSGGRLPTEAEWEYACRSGTTTAYNTGSCLGDLQANYNWAYPGASCMNTNSIYPGKTLPVGSYPANAFGLYDMHGNVWEWCSDWYGPYPVTDQTNPTGPASGDGRIFRGGSWYGESSLCRSALRDSGFPSNSFILGFRIVVVP